jgi:CRISPR-associated protein Cmr4
VKQRALFYQEFLPAETLFYCLVIAEDSRRKDVKKDAVWTLRYAQQNVPAVLQIGGNETIGKGLCAVRLIPTREV